MNPPSATRPLTAGQRAGHLLVANRVGQAKVEAGHQEQHRQRRGELEKDRYATDQCRHAEHEPVAEAHHHLHVGK